MNDPGWLADRDGDELEHPAVAVWSDGQQSVLAVVVVLDEPDRIGSCVLNVGLVDAVLECRGRHLHTSRMH